MTSAQRRRGAGQNRMIVTIGCASVTLTKGEGGSKNPKTFEDVICECFQREVGRRESDSRAACCRKLIEFYIRSREGKEREAVRKVCTGYPSPK